MALLEVVALSNSFGGLAALSQVDLNLTEGQIANVIGPNGAGKTRFFKALTGLYPAATGTIRFAGRIVEGLEPEQITALGIARTFQNIRLFGDMSVLENVPVGMHCRLPFRFWSVLLRSRGIARVEREAWKRGNELLERVGLRAEGNALARDLPYGDQRRPEIARALATNPNLLLLDDPMAGMNPAEARILIGFLRRLGGDLGVTLLLIEHNMRVVMSISGRVTVLDHGEKIAEGSPRKFSRIRGSRRFTWAAGSGEGKCPAMMLEIEGLHVHHGSISALRGVTSTIPRGEIVVLLGGNGAGKSTTLKTTSGLLKPCRETVRLNGERIDCLPPFEIVRCGVSHVPEGRRVSPRLPVLENLEMGAYSRRDGKISEDVERAFALFPRLAERRTQVAGTLSGGEQQMPADGRALMSNPSLSSAGRTFPGTGSRVGGHDFFADRGDSRARDHDFSGGEKRPYRPRRGPVGLCPGNRVYRRCRRDGDSPARSRGARSLPGGIFGEGGRPPDSPVESPSGPEVGRGEGGNHGPDLPELHRG